MRTLLRVEVMGEWCNCIFLSMAAHSRMFCAMDHQHTLLMIIVKIDQYFPICIRISYELTFFSCCLIEVFTLKIAFFLQWKLLYTYWWGEKLMGSWHLLPWPFGEKKISSGDLRSVIFPEYPIADVHPFSMLVDKESMLPWEISLWRIFPRVFFEHPLPETF